ncbi:TPA: 4-hydroxy-3-methylbut-2-enyl diphosphate reductase [bacterium]|nr:4-hydroxy-3-methylbut-2-enyl diphosphate reductase [bacterium]
MEVLLSKGAGFCFGVKRAVSLADEVLRRGKRPVYTLGPLIHNPQVIREFEEKGIKVVGNLDKVHPGTVILRSHGVAPSIQMEAKDKGFEIVDATCPRVKRVQQLAARLKKEGYQVVVIGERGHPEVASILELLRDADVIESFETIARLPKVKRIGVIAQTTQHMEHFKELCKLLISKAEEVRIYNTICEASITRQKNSLELAKGVDLMIVVGGYNSANTRRLTEICKAVAETHHIEEAAQIKEKWLKERERIGVTAGASTPISIINEVLRRLHFLAAHPTPKNQKNSPSRLRNSALYRIRSSP